MYSEDIIIKYSDLSPNGRASLPALLRIFQNAAIDHSALDGHSVKRLRERDRAWILISMNVNISRYPDYGEGVRVETFASGVDRIFGFRKFLLVAEDGHELAKAASMWTFLDTSTGRPARVFEDVAEKYGREEGPAIEYVRREPKTGICSEVSKITVGKRDIDTNRHVNNVRLAEFMTEALPIGCEVRRAQIFYRSASYEGDVLSVAVCEENGEVGAELKDGGGKVRAAARFALF